MNTSLVLLLVAIVAGIVWLILRARGADGGDATPGTSLKDDGVTAATSVAATTASSDSSSSSDGGGSSSS